MFRLLFCSWLMPRLCRSYACVYVAGLTAFLCFAACACACAASVKQAVMSGTIWIIFKLFKPPAHEWKQLSKLPCKAVCTAVCSRVRRSFRENFATSRRGKYLSCLIFLASKGRFLTVCGERVNRAQPD